MTQKSHKAKLLFILFLLTALITEIAGAAEMKFIRQNLEIPVRRGRGERYKILEFVKDGDQLELIRENGNWAKVRLTGGTEGWMLKRYLSDEQPLVEQVRILREENEKLKTDNETLNRNLTRVKELQEASTEELEQLQTSAEKKLAVSLQECNKIKDEHKAAQEVNKIMWFLSGAGVLLLGWLIGRLSGGSQRKRNRLL